MSLWVWGNFDGVFDSNRKVQTSLVNDNSLVDKKGIVMGQS